MASWGGGNVRDLAPALFLLVFAGLASLVLCFATQGGSLFRVWPLVVPTSRRRRLPSGSSMRGFLQRRQPPGGPGPLELGAGVAAKNAKD